MVTPFAEPEPLPQYSGHHRQHTHPIASTHQQHSSYPPHSQPYPYIAQPRHSSQVPYAQPPHPGGPFPLQGPEAHAMIAQAFQSLSYLMTATGYVAPNAVSPPQGGWPQPPPAGYAPPYPEDGHWPPYTPAHQRHFRDTSGSSSAYNTPTHPHPYPRSYTPSFSGATLPPSSPPPPSSPVEESSSGGRPRSLVVGRSKSRGRRVSFKLDEEDRPDMGEPSSPTARVHQRRPPSPSQTSSTSNKHGHAKSTATAGMPIAATAKAKGVGTARPLAGNDENRRDSSKAQSKAFERGQTPGPFSRISSDSSEPPPARPRGRPAKKT